MRLPEIDEVMPKLEPYLDMLDRILREAHEKYLSYTPEILLELDSRAQAACTYCHIVACAEREFEGLDGIRAQVLPGDLKLWHIEEANAVIRFKKTDEDGRSRNYPTKQAQDYDKGEQLPGLPMPPTHLTAGYVLDDTAQEYQHSVIALPRGKRRVAWCAAVIPPEERTHADTIWFDDTKQTKFA